MGELLCGGVEESGVCVVGAMVGGGGGEVVGVGVGVGEGGRLGEVGGGGEGREWWRRVSCMLSCPPVGWLWSGGVGLGGSGLEVLDWVSLVRRCWIAAR